MVYCRQEAGLATVVIDNPPVNALAQPVRAALLAEIDRLERDEAVEAIVIVGGGGNFVAGAEIRELDVPTVPPVLADVLSRIEACDKPVVAAMSGFVLGGGLELALACHYRCAAPGARFGLPEVKLGLLPGAGGTQRLPRLVGSVAAAGMMLDGEPIDSERALELGLIDVILESSDVTSEGLAYVRRLMAAGAGPRRLSDAPAPEAPPEALMGQHRHALAKRWRGLMSPRLILDCVEAASTLSFEEGVALSRRMFEECRQSASSRALRHLFFAERAVGRSDAPHREVERVAVVGSGTMGIGIAIALVEAGIPVAVLDSDRDALERGRARFLAHYADRVRRGRCAESQAAALVGLVEFGNELVAAGRCDLVIEAVFENLRVKQEVFGALDGIMPPHALLATNTSYLDIDRIAAATRRPESVLGLHFFSPANVMRLVEVVRGAATTEAALATGARLARRLRKVPVIVGNSTGFIGNRMLQAYGGESQSLLLEGASPAQVDAALEAWGMAMGPCAVYDLAGLDVGYRARRERTDLPHDPRYFRVADLLVESGRLGRKSRSGHYLYAEDGQPRPDPSVVELIAAEAERLGIQRRAVTDEEIVSRCLHALISEGEALLRSGVARCAADIDVVWVNGYGFPRYRGGPMWFAASLADARG